MKKSSDKNRIERLKISIVMATYNGEKYINEQLDSIRKQSRPADEIIICDDCSDDATLDIIYGFIEKYNLKDWTVKRNETNQGWRKNFFQGFYEATGDIIFCADQDDIWDINKVLKMTSLLEENPQINILACNLDPFYEKENFNKNLTSYQLNKYGKKLLKKVEFSKSWLEPRRPGCAICFRKEILTFIEKIWFEDCPHDLSLWAYGVSSGSLYIFNEKLVRYRRHAGTNTPSNKKNRETRSFLMMVYHKLAKKVIENAKELELPDSVIDKVKRLDRFYLIRKQAISTGNILLLIVLILQLPLYPKPSSWGGDIMAALRK